MGLVEYDADTEVESGIAFTIHLAPQVELPALDDRVGVGGFTDLAPFDAANGANHGNQSTGGIVGGLQVAFLCQDEAAKGFLIPLRPAILVHRVGQDLQAAAVLEIGPRQDRPAPQHTLKGLSFDLYLYSPIGPPPFLRRIRLQTTLLPHANRLDPLRIHSLTNEIALHHVRPKC